MPDIRYSYADVPTVEEFSMSNARIRGLKGPFGCTSAKTEFLTPTGWKRIDQWQPGDLVAQWDRETNAIEFVEAKAYIRRECEELIEFRSGGLVMQLSPEHRVPHLNWAGSFQVKTAEQIERKPSRRTIPTTFAGHDQDSLDMSDDMIRFAVMMHADGHYVKNGRQAVVSVRKERKKERLRAMLERLGIEFQERIYSGRPTESNFRFYPPYRGKRFTGKWWGASRRELAIVLEEMRYWDGHDGGDLRFATTHKEDADFIQYAAHANGLRAVIRDVAKNEKNERWATNWNVYIRGGDNAKNRACIREETEISRIPPQDGMKYCFMVPSSFWVARCENTIFITGNSGKSSGCAVEIPQRAIQVPRMPDGIRRSRWAVIRNTNRELQETTLKTLHQWLPPHHFGRYVESKHTFTVRAFEGCEFEIVDLALDRQEDISKLLSLELTGAWVNEAREVPWSVIEALDGRIGRFPPVAQAGPYWCGIWMDTNPPDQDSKWYQYFEEKSWLKSFRALKSAGALPPEMQEEDYAAIFNQPSGLSPNAENLANLRQGYYQQLAIGKAAEWVKVYIHGEYGFVSEGKLVYPEYSDAIHCKEVDPIPGTRIIRSWDFGLTPSCIFSQQLPDGRWLVFDEMVSDNMSIDEFSDEVIERCNRAFRGQAEFEDWGDPAGDQRAQTDKRTCFEIMQAKGIQVEGSVQNPQLRQESVRKPLRTLIGGEPQFVMHPRCKTLRKGFMGGYHRRKLNVPGPERYSEEPAKNAFSHPHDALQYAMVKYFAPVLLDQQQGDDELFNSLGNDYYADATRSSYTGY